MNTLLNNLILNTDSYKCSHWVQYPPNTTGLFSYIEARGTTTEANYNIFFGIQHFIRAILSNKVTRFDIDVAAAVLAKHGEPFNESGWRYIVDTYNGYLPIKIRAVKEGTKVPVGNVLVTVESTDDNCAWLESFLETAILRSVWYPTTVATNSHYCKSIIMDSLRKTSDNPEAEIGFKLHDFGARGVSSNESAAIGGMAHLVNFMGTDTISGILCAMESYDADVCGYSIPAAEHSTITSWGKDNEYSAYLNMVEQYAKPGAIFAVVSDSYDIYNAVRNIWIKGGLLEKVKAASATVVIRPDSGDPTKVPVELMQIIADEYGYTMNSKGYKVLPPEVRIIQGDGITPDSLKIILKNVEAAGFSASNIAFGMGGGLLQLVNRDTYKFAMKCSAAKVNGEWVDVFKQPVTDSGKNSKRGRITLGYFLSEDDHTPQTVSIQKASEHDDFVDLMHTIYENGPVVEAYDSFDVVRQRANSSI